MKKLSLTFAYQHRACGCGRRPKGSYATSADSDVPGGWPMGL